MIEGMDEIRLAMIRSLLKLIDEDTKFTIFFAVLFFMFRIKLVFLWELWGIFN